MPLKKSVVGRLTLAVIAIVALVIAATGLVSPIGRQDALESARRVSRFNSAPLLDGIDRSMSSRSNEGLSESIRDAFEDIHVVALVADGASCTEAARRVQKESGPIPAFLGGEYSLAGIDALPFGINASLVVAAVVAILLGAVALSIIETQRKKLRDAREYLEAIVENSADFIITVNPHGIIQTINRGAEEGLGYRREELIGRPIDILFADPHEREIAIARLDDQPSVSNYETRFLTKDREIRHVLLTLSRLRDREGNPIGTMGISKDITDVKNLEKEKLEAERLAAVGETVAGLAHGVKNILMGLDGGVYIVRTGMKRSDAKRVSFGWEILEDNIEKISTFMKEFLDFAKGREARVKRVDPNLIATQVVDLFKESARLAGIELTYDLDKGVEPAWLDEEGIHTCLVNLISNAVDACEMGDGKDGHVHVRTLDRDGVLTFEVADNGIGIGAELGKKIFTKFFSTKGSERGTGLGLLTTRKIVQQHGGTVSFESNEGAGSRFCLEFPRHRLPRPSENEN